jgi:nitronate monooxygenase
VAWSDTPLARELGVRLPIVQAPMAGGPSTPRLAAAVSAAGGLGSIAGAMLAPDQLRAAIAEVRSLTGAPFAVNLFAPQPPPRADRVVEWSSLTGVPLAERPPPPSFDDQLDVVVAERVPVFSFTFGIPPLAGVDAVILGTATTVAEAVALEAAGVTAVVAQGFEAGGHRGTFDRPVDRSLIGAMALVPQVVDAVKVPVIAAGGIADGRGFAAALALGASAVQVGTAYLFCPEAKITAPHRAALKAAWDDDTVLTRVFTGRPARGIANRIIREVGAMSELPPAFPLAGGALMPLRGKAEPAGSGDFTPMWSGQAMRLGREMSTEELTRTLVRETQERLRQITGD